MSDAFAIERLRLSSAPISAIACGDPRAPLVVCLHGFPDIPRTWEQPMRGLSEAGYYVVAPWLRGYAPSLLQGPFDVPTLVADLVTLIDELAPEQEVRLVGHDWGAAIVYMAMATMPDRIASAVTIAVPHLGALQDNLARVPSQLLRSWYMAFFQFPLITEAVVGHNDFSFIDWMWKAWSPGYEMPDNYRKDLKLCFTASMPGPVSFYRAFRSFANAQSAPCVCTANLGAHIVYSRAR